MKVVNAYLPHSDGSRGYQFPGIGDFIRGSVCLFQICQALDLEFEMNFSKHPLEATLARPSRAIDESVEAIPYYPADSRPQLFELLRGGLQAGRTALVLFTNCVPSDGPDGRCRQFMVSRLAPNERIRRVVSSVRARHPDYDVLHVRLTDSSLFEDAGVPEPTSHAVRAVCADARRPLIVMSSSARLKAQIERWGLPSIITLAGQPRHCGFHSDLETTMIDFHVMAHARRILQISDYPWGSGFSDWCARLHEIPLVRVPLAGSPPGA